MNKIHAVVGRGIAPAQVLRSGLKDAAQAPDELALVWDGKPNAAMEAIYDWVLDNEAPFSLYYEEGATPPRVFRESEFGVVVKVRDAFASAVKSVTGNVLYLWDNEDGAQVDIWRVFDYLPAGAGVLELTNGLTPIAVDHTSNDEVIKPPVTSTAAIEDEVLSEDDERFSKYELETMTAASVKRYGARLGLTATTKSGIIEELFPSEEADYGNAEEEADAVDAAAMISLTIHPLLLQLRNITEQLTATIEMAIAETRR